MTKLESYLKEFERNPTGEWIVAMTSPLSYLREITGLTTEQIIDVFTKSGTEEDAIVKMREILNSQLFKFLYL